MMVNKKVAILVGGSDLFSGFRGISKGTRVIKESIKSHFDHVFALNYNYFLDFGRSLKYIDKFLTQNEPMDYLTLYGYSKGGDIALQISRLFKRKRVVDLLVTIDVANGPWSGKIDRSVPGNVMKNINVFQTVPNFPLRSHGMAAYSTVNVEIENINITNQIINGTKVNHSNIEFLMVPKVIEWIIPK